MSTVKHDPTGSGRGSAEPSDAMAKKLSESMVGEDEPMAKEHPRAPGALVWFSYPLVLAIAILAVVAFIAFFYR